MPLERHDMPRLIRHTCCWFRRRYADTLRRFAVFHTLITLFTMLLLMPSLPDCYGFISSLAYG